MRDWLDSIEARTRAQAKYDKKHTVGLYLKLNVHTDRDILQWLWRQGSKQGSIKRLIREELARESCVGRTPTQGICQDSLVREDEM